MGGFCGVHQCRLNFTVGGQGLAQVSLSCGDAPDVSDIIVTKPVHGAFRSQCFVQAINPWSAASSSSIQGAAVLSEIGRLINEINIRARKIAGRPYTQIPRMKN